jgi:glycosyltransferase involved in cell wall biosynthesis
MRIAIIGTRGFPYVYSGYETFVSEIAGRLVAKGHQVTVYCHRSLFRERPEQVDGVHLVYLPAIERKVLSQFSHSLLSTLHALFGSFDALLYVNSANGPFGLLTSLRGIKTAINVDGVEWLRPKWHGLGARYFKWSSWMATRLFDAIIADSTSMRDIYLREFNAESTVIEYGADAAECPSSQHLSQFGLEKNGYYLIVGRMVPDNNVLLMAEGFASSSSSKRLVVIGDVPYKDDYAHRVKSVSDPRVIFPGYVRDSQVLQELYSNCYVYLHGHEFGGTNPSLLKALGWGCCVAALDTVFSREVLDGDKHALYFEKSKSSVLNVVKRLDGDPALVESLRTTARSRILERYTWERITDEYERLLLSLIK